MGHDEDPVVSVQCYAGASYPERPTAFEWRGRRLAVASWLWQQRTPAGLIFLVTAEDGLRYRLEWQQTGDAWSVAGGVPSREFNGGF